MYQFYFEKLEVWSMSRALVKELYIELRSFPKYDYEVISQIKRAAVSIPTNIAEGTGRLMSKDQARFTTIAYSSLLELMNLLIIATDLGYIESSRLLSYRNKISQISNMLNALHKTQMSYRRFNS